MKSKGYRSGTRKKFSQPFRDSGMPLPTKYLQQYRRGDYVDIKVDPSIHKGMPFKYYHGRTGRVQNVNPRSLTVIVGRRYGNKIVEKKIIARIEHVKDSKCNLEYLERKSNFQALKKEAAENGEITFEYKRKAKGAKKELLIPLKNNQPKEIFYDPFYEVY